MKLKLNLNDFFKKYTLFTVSSKLLDSMKDYDFQLNPLSQYPNLSKVLPPEVLSETLASLIYLNKGNYASFGILAKAMNSSVKIYDTDNNLLYNSETGQNEIPTNIGTIVFGSLDYSIVEELSGAIRDLAKELLWILDDSTSILADSVNIELVNDTTYYNESDIDYVYMMELT